MAKALGKAIKFGVFISGIFLGLVFLRADAAEAATMYFVPNSGTHLLGDNFSVSVYLASTDQAANAVSGVLAFPLDKMTVTSIVKTGSIISLWTQDPSFSNGNGTVKFEGIVLNPGYKGAGGKILTINFKVKATGAATMNFTSGSILANDGLGTNILSGLGSAKFAFNAPQPKTKPLAATTPVVTPAVPGAPQVFSSSHPDPARWYADRSPSFSWVNPTGVTGVSLLIDQNSNTDPGAISNGVFAFYTAKDIADGTWYFHVRLQNDAGWGSISHFRFQVDTQSPLPFVISMLDGSATDNPSPRFQFTATDTLSGIESYKVKVDNGDYFQVYPQTLIAGPLTILPQVSGKHNIIVQAYDRAGNSVISAADFVVRGLSAPVFTEYPSVLDSGAVFVAKGTTFPNSDVTVLLTSDSNPRIEQVVRSDAAGVFAFISLQKLNNGLYQLSASVSDSRGAKSEWSRPIVISVQPPPFIRIGTVALSVLAVFVPLFALLILLFLLVYWLYRKYRDFRSKVKKEATKAETVLHESFVLLRENLKKYIASLESVQQARHLTLEEEAMMIQLKLDLNTVETMVGKEIKEIEETVK